MRSVSRFGWDVPYSVIAFMTTTVSLKTEDFAGSRGLARDRPAFGKHL